MRTKWGAVGNQDREGQYFCSQRTSKASERCPPANPQPGGGSGTRDFSLNCFDSARPHLCTDPSSLGTDNRTKLPEV